jgi:hypothetical protein
MDRDGHRVLRGLFLSKIATKHIRQAERTLTMKQIKSIGQNKKTPNHQHLFICNNILVRLVDSRWNHLYSDLLLMYEKLRKLGLAYSDKQIIP